MESIYLKVTQDYVPTDNDKKDGGKNNPISVERGDIIFDVRKLDDGWLTGKNLNTGRSGRFPSSCTAKLSDIDSNKDSSAVDTGPKAKDSVTKEPASAKPLKSWQKSTSPEANKDSDSESRRPANPRPFALSSKKPRSPNDNAERKETSADSGVVEDSEDYYLNDDPAGKGKPSEAKKPTFGKIYETRKPTEAANKSLIYEPSRFQASKIYSPGLVAKRPSVSKLKSAFLDQDPKTTKAQDMKDKPEKNSASGIELKNRSNISQPGKKAESKRPIGKAALAKDDEDDDTLYANYTEVDESKPADENKNDKTDGAKTAKKINIKENPLSEEESGAPYHSYQVPLSAPDKPEKTGGCSECDEPHIYAAPSNYQEPPSSPEAKQGKYDFDPTETPASRDKTQEKQPLEKTKDKEKEEANRRSYNRMASYESIGNIGPEKSKSAKSCESLKEAVKKVKRTKQNLVSSGRYPRMRIIGGITLGLVIGIFIFFMVYLLAKLHVLTALVAGFIVGFVCSIVFGFLDRKRTLCVALLVFPSLFASRGKVALWIIITFFIIAGPLCNFVANIEIIATGDGCVLSSTDHNISSNDTSNKHVHPALQHYRSMALDLELLVSQALSRMDYTATNTSGNYTVCENLMNGAKIECARSANNIYNYCTSKFLPTGKEGDVRQKCEELLSEKLCSPISESLIADTCEKFDILQCKQTLVEIRGVLNDSRVQALIGGKPLVTAGNGTEKCSGFVSVAGMLLPLLVLLVLYEAYRYHKLYMAINNFDNQYLTSHFKTIEDTRKASGAGDGLIPLKKGELQRFIQPTSWQFTITEKEHMAKSFAAYFLYLFFALIIILVDYYVYFTITSKKQSQQLKDESLNKTNTTTEAGPVVPVCIREVHPLSYVYLVVISTLLGLLLLMITIQPYVLRLRHYIASKLYRRRERKRIAYLYYKILEERKAFLKEVIDKINLRSEENHAMDSLDSVRVLAWNFGPVETVLTGIGVNLRECMVCGRGLNRKYIYCETESCEAIYCRTCFWDLENKCLGCMRNSNPVSRSSSCNSGNGKKKRVQEV
ncbi:DC-STAMP domain-containing protein 2-like [Nematostella vectensis]|uniref:DC-STAMP domain-containing protein 2-like n=1 Tax=Nematostella vectensis TaxID=45351 RepID=UPI00138FE93F|nr:DC-STAMP domain-containing protein 2-like [Nematostella vectensis]